eukprot:8718512-Alexandrium_andersonii.AAC.1
MDSGWDRCRTCCWALSCRRWTSSTSAAPRSVSSLAGRSTGCRMHPCRAVPSPARPAGSATGAT